MQVSHAQQLEDGRQTRAIGAIKAVGVWRAAGAGRGEADRYAALKALIREVEDCGADAILGLEFEIDGCARSDIGSVPLQRVVARGVAARFAIAA